MDGVIVALGLLGVLVFVWYTAADLDTEKEHEREAETKSEGVTTDSRRRTYAILNPVKYVADARARNQRNREFAKREQELHDKIAKALPEDKPALIAELRDELNRFIDASGLSRAEIEARARRRQMGGPPDIDISSMDGMTRAEVVEAAKALKVPARGRTTQIKRNVIAEEERRAAAKGRARTREQAEAITSTETGMNMEIERSTEPSSCIPMGNSHDLEEVMLSAFRPSTEIHLSARTTIVVLAVAFLVSASILVGFALSHPLYVSTGKDGLIVMNSWTGTRWTTSQTSEQVYVIKLGEPIKRVQ